MPDSTPNRNCHVRNNRRNTELIDRDRQQLIRHLQRQQNIRNWIREWRTKMRAIIENGGIIWISSDIPFTYVIVKNAPSLAIARVYGQATKIDSMGNSKTYLRCDLFSRKPVELNPNTSDTNSRFRFECDFKDFPVEKDLVLQYLHDPEIIRDENNVIQALRFHQDPLEQYISTGIY